jgi:hypothetical protein
MAGRTCRDYPTVQNVRAGNQPVACSPSHQLQPHHRSAGNSQEQIPLPRHGLRGGTSTAERRSPGACHHREQLVVGRENIVFPVLQSIFTSAAISGAAPCPCLGVPMLVKGKSILPRFTVWVVCGCLLPSPQRSYQADRNSPPHNITPVQVSPVPCRGGRRPVWLATDGTSRMGSRAALGLSAPWQGRRPLPRRPAVPAPPSR